MTLPDAYLRYPLRRRGMDHDRYAYSRLFARKPVSWPGNARVALWIVPTLELFPLDMAIGSVKPAGALDRPYPDLWNYTLRDYGNRVGAARILRALETRGLKASVAMSAGLAARYPHLVRDCVGLGHEIVAHGLDMGHVHAGDLASNDERGWVERSLALLRDSSGQSVKGWYSPAHAETWTTLDLVAEAGCSYVCDWVNDDMPYRLTTASGALCAMPLGFEISDLQLCHVYRHTAAQYARQVKDHFDQLYREAADHGGRIVALSLRPWVSGVPHRIAAVEDVFDHMLSHAGVWNATGAEILSAWQNQQI